MLRSLLIKLNIVKDWPLKACLSLFNKKKLAQGAKIVRDSSNSPLSVHELMFPNNKSGCDIQRSPGLGLRH